MSQATVGERPKALPALPSPEAQLWAYNRVLLSQGVAMIDLLQAKAQADFRYAQAVGPHLRHIIEHYQALLKTLAAADTDCVDYDARSRALDVQNDPVVTRQRLTAVMSAMEALAEDARWRLATPLTTRLQAGTTGELALVVETTLGRELLFLASHTTHHYALLAHHCQAAGVALGANFGKAPATVAFERKAAAGC
jgi:hypothetical protein